MSKIHPTAIVHTDAHIAEDVQIGPYSIVEPDVEIGPGCVLREHVVIRRYVRMGANNFVDAHTILGGAPQDLKWNPSTVSYLQIGRDNVFREGVTISRASKADQATVVGDRTYWMACSHAGHDVTIGDEVILCNNALVGGHASRVFLSGHVAIHQFTWIGEGVMSQGKSGVGMHVPPYCMFADTNRIAGLNAVGLRRNKELTEVDRRQIKEVFRLTYRSGLTLQQAIEEMSKRNDWGSAATKFHQFLQDVIAARKPYNRGLCPHHSKRD